MTSDKYIIWADVFNVGGQEDSDSASYSLQDSLGEALILSATSTAANYGLKAGFREMYPDQYLSFSSSATSIDFEGTESGYTGGYMQSHTLTIDTNATKGFTITLSGNTLTKGSDTINAIGQVASAYNLYTEQFGFNLVDNSQPENIGANPSGTAPIGSVSSPFNVANQYAFNDTATNIIATASNDISETTYTVSYLLSFSGFTQPGVYTTTLTFAATANF